MDRLENGVQLENGDRPKNGASHRLETGALATLGLVLMLLMFGGPCRAQADAAPRLEIPVEDARALGLRIWQNESARSEAGLTAWNRGEDFASMGIGHFIWYPAGVEKRFDERFPALLEFLAERGVTLPDWLRDRPACPWSERAAFLADFESPRMRALRTLLADTVIEQSLFILRRLSNSMAVIEAHTPVSQHARLRARYDRLAASPRGIYALVDYVNFKGEGVAPGERYQGHGWGLSQVLGSMRDSSDPVADFTSAAEAVLRRRVALSPPARNEQRWLAGWLRRVRGYVDGG